MAGKDSSPVRIRSIQKPISGYSFVRNNEERPGLENLSHVNVFVGANNSGKSRALRSLCSQDLKFLPVLENELEEIGNKIDGLRTKLSDFLSERNYSHFEGLSESLPTAASDLIIEENKGMLPWLQPMATALSGNNFTIYSNSQTRLSRHSQEVEILQQLLMKDFNELHPYRDYKISFKKIYIPTLRGLRILGEEDVYRNRTMEDYFSKAGENLANRPDIFTGLDLYARIRSLLLGDLDQRNRIAKFQRFLSVHFFRDKDVVLIPREGSDVLYIKMERTTNTPSSIWETEYRR